MGDTRLRLIAAAGLIVGAALGIAGTFVPSASLRALLWGVDGTALVMAGAALTIRYLREQKDVAAAGFLIFTLGQTLILSGSAMDVAAAAPSFAAGISLWSVALVVVGVSGALPLLVRLVGFVAALLFAIVALRICGGEALNALSTPLPFFAYPFLAVTLVGWAWEQIRAR